MEGPNVIRQRELQPVGDKIMVKPLKAEKITKGGIHIPDTAKRPPLMGLVLAAGPGRHSEAGTLIESPVKAGQRVVFHRFSGTEINDTDDNTVILMTTDDVLAIIESPPSSKCCLCGNDPLAERTDNRDQVKA